MDMYKELIGHIDVELLLPQQILEKLKHNNVYSISEYDSSSTVHWFVIDDINIKTSRKGKPYLLLNVLGSNGEQNRMFCWGIKDTHQIKLRKNSLCLAKIDHGEFGFSTRVWDVRMLN